MRKKKPLPTREGPWGVEIVRKGTSTTILNFHHNGLVHSSHVMEYNEITMPEALIFLATQMRMGNL